LINLMQGDCLERMKEIPDGSVDMVLTDPPYGTTACKWDSIIPLEPMWEQLKRTIKPNGAIVLFGQEPFSSYLRVSNVDQYKYDWQWRKSRPAGFTNAKLKPLKDLENICVFSEGATANGSKRNMPYNPQGLEDCDEVWSRPTNYTGGDRGVCPARENSSLKRKITKKGYPRQVLDFPNPNDKNVHPTQKPVALMEYLIKTYTNEGETVLDFTMGSGTTGVSCKNLNRRFIGIELDEQYFKIAQDRISAT
jgi:site-specific DNA-methyltransferase (adenine-specific)